MILKIQGYLLSQLSDAIVPREPNVHDIAIHAEHNVFNLYELDDFSHKEISAMLDISVGTSKSNLSRAKQALKEKLLTKNQKYKTSKHGS